MSADPPRTFAASPQAAPLHEASYLDDDLLDTDLADVDLHDPDLFPAACPPPTIVAPGSPRSAEAIRAALAELVARESARRRARMGGCEPDLRVGP